MKLYQQLILFMLAATVLPLVVVGFWVLNRSETELTSRISAEQRTLGVLVAERASDQLAQLIDSVGRAAELIDWQTVTPEEARGGLSLLYQQDEAIAAVAYVDHAGDNVVDPVYVEHPEGNKASFDPAGLPALRSAIPLQALSHGARGETVLSDPYRRPDGTVAIALAVKVSPDPDSPFVLAEIALQRLSKDLQTRAKAEHYRMSLLTRDGTVIASTEPEELLKKQDKEAADWLQVLKAQNSRSTTRLGSDIVSAAQGSDRLGLLALVRANADEALRPVTQMRRTVLIGAGIALLVLLALGAAFTRRINSRLGTVVKGAEALGRGELGTRVPVSGADELSELARTFNDMGGELEKARAKLLTWNDELQKRVDEATADLRAAQAQLVEAQKLAAVGQLGAGVAHEINNPLAGILGNTQLLMLDMDSKNPDFDTLKKIEQSAKRCKEITQNLLRFSQQKDKFEPRPMDVNIAVRDALAMSASQSQAEGVTVINEASKEPVRVNGDPGQLTQVLLAMIVNARTAMMKSEVKKLTVRSRDEGDAVVLEVEDTGKGIKAEHLSRIFEPFFTTKDIWQNVGLGLSVAYRVVTEHKGRIDVKTEVGKGTVFTIRLPKLDLAAQKVASAKAASNVVTWERSHG